MKKTYKRRVVNGKQYSLLTLPGSDFFQFEIVNKIASNIERAVNKETGKNLFGISHFIEHLGFRAPKDYTTENLMQTLINEGLYNASTNHDRINYWYRTISNRAELAIKVVCNYALNDLKDIPIDEFDIEKKVVYNEAKRYADDDQTMFHFNTAAAMCGYDITEDNVIGIASTIDEFTLDDAIYLKDVFLSHGIQIYNVTYDPTHLSEDKVIDMIERQLERFPVSRKSEYDSLLALHDDMISYPRIGTFSINNESEQVMTSIMIDATTPGVGSHTATVANDYLAQFSKTSLNNIIREKHGLTYGIYFLTELVSGKPYTFFACDVSKGTEGQLMELFVDSICQSVDEYTAEKHKKYIDIRTLKRVMAVVDQKQYTKIHELGTWHPAVADKYKNVLATDVDAAFVEMDAVSGDYISVQLYMDLLRKLVITNEYSKVTNLK